MSSVPNLSETVLEFIQKCVPITEAIQVLLLFHRDPGKQWALDDLTRATRLSAAVVADCVRVFRSNGLVVEQATGFRYAPNSPALAHALEAFIQAYNERPVSVIRAIYAPRPESKVKAFADAFKLRKE